jgi:hypothetical protein
VRGVAGRPDVDFDDFICTCDDDGRKAAAEQRTEVKRLLAAGSPNQGPHPVDDANFVSEVVWSLNWDFGAQITEIASDQWFGIWAAADDGSFKTFIQCDALEDGFAATWKAFAERRPATQR